MMHVLLLWMCTVGQVEGDVLAPSPSTEGAPSQPAPAPPADARGVDPRDLDDGAPVSGEHDDVDDPASDVAAPAVQEGPGKPLTGAVSALAGSAGTAAAMLAWVLLAPLVSVASAIPGASLLVVPAYLVLLGLGGGTAAWLVSGLVGKRRVPWLPLVGAGALGMLVAVIGGVAAALFFSAPAYAGAAAGYALAVASLVGGTWTMMVTGFAVFGVAMVLAGVVMGVSYLAALSAGCLGTGGVLGLLTTLLGRQRVAGESGVLFDPLTVPSPREDMDAEGDDDDEDAQRRPGSRSSRPRKRAQRLDAAED